MTVVEAADDPDGEVGDATTGGGNTAAPAKGAPLVMVLGVETTVVDPNGKIPDGGADGAASCTGKCEPQIRLVSECTTYLM